MTTVTDMAREGSADAGPGAVHGFSSGPKARSAGATAARSNRILVAIPCLNEGATIGSVVLKARQHADEVVVVDDGSSDDTAEVAELAGAKVLRHARNLGKGMAIRTAWLYAREAHPDAFVLMDGDHQHNTEDIPRLAKRVLSGDADMVIGVRWGKTSGMPMYRRVGKRVLDYATAVGTKNGKLTDSQSGYRVFSSEALLALEPTEDGLSIESAMLIEAQEKGLRIDEVNVDFDYDLEGSNVSPGRHGTGVLGRLVTLVSQKRPLLFFGSFGLGLLIVAAALGALVLSTYYASRALATGTLFIVLLFGIVGILSIFIGITLNALVTVATKSSAR
ncbi:MAG TPA: glycosyltransferase family 2 protein [Thermoplasmata archaeon]|nr:glycosyltransferase family 2 protein [Thermoplasmata archaeon]